MDNSEAKLVLSAYRPDGQEAQDPRMKEALEQAKCDPQLALWLAEQQTFDRLICDKLSCCCVPKDLKTTILTSGQQSLSKPWWNHPYGWALAAVLLVVLGLGIFMRPTSFLKPTLAEYRDDVAQLAGSFIDQGMNLDYTSQEQGQVIDWVIAQKLASRINVTGGISQSEPFGCRAIDWRGHRLAMVCFKDQQNQVAHLFILNRQILGNLPERQVKEISRIGGLPIATWYDEMNAYVLVGHDPSVRIADFL